MSAAKYCIGVHNWDQGSYTTGDLAAYAAALGDGVSLAGAVAHLKFRDFGEKWRTGAIPTMSTHNQTFLAEAKALGMTTLVAYVPENAWNNIGNASLMANLETAAALAASTYTDVDAWLMGNERQQKTVDNAEDWFYVENLCGQVWQGAGKQWAAGADQAPNNLLSTIETRRSDYWATDPDWLVFHEYGAIPAHVREIRLAVEALTGRTWNIVFTEWALDFEGLGAEGSKPWIRDYRAREYTEWWGRALRKERVYGCYFTLREIKGEDPVEAPFVSEPLSGLADALSETPVASEPAAQTPTSAGLKTWRYNLYGPNRRAYWNATWKGWRVLERHRQLRAGYWE